MCIRYKTISLDELYNWPPHRMLGEVEDVSNCQQCHGSQIISTKIGENYNTHPTLPTTYPVYIPVDAESLDNKTTYQVQNTSSLRDSQLVVQHTQTDNNI